jgi:hypothetical protein
LLTQSDWLAVAGIAASPLTAIIGFMFGYAAKRPKLRLSGTGSGSRPIGSRDLMLTSVQLYNEPRFCGLPVAREAAEMTEARLYDFELRELVGHQLMWAVAGTDTLSPRTTVQSGRQATLYIFAKDRYADEFFAYHSSSLSTDPPRSPARYTEKKKPFALWLRDVNGRQYKFPLQVRNTDQSVHVHSNIGWWHRLRLHFYRP